MKKLKKIVRIIFYVLLIFIIGFEIFQYIKIDGNVMLYVSNQSSQVDTIDIKILIDGKEIINDTFVSGNFHNYKEYSLKLSPIVLHEIEVYSEKVHAKMVTQIRFCFVNWVLLDLWNEEPDLESVSSDGELDFLEVKKKKPTYWFTIDRSLYPIIFM